MMLAKMMIEMPLPMPFSVMSSPSHTRNMVPAVRVASVVTVGRNALPLNRLNWVAGIAPMLTSSAIWPKACSKRERHGKIALNLRYAILARLALSRQSLELGNNRLQELHDDGSGDVRIQAQSQDGEILGERAAGEDVEQSKYLVEGAAVATQGLADRGGVNARYRNTGYHPKDQQHSNCKQNLLA